MTGSTAAIAVLWAFRDICPYLGVKGGPKASGRRTTTSEAFLLLKMQKHGTCKSRKWVPTVPWRYFKQQGGLGGLSVLTLWPPIHILLHTPGSTVAFPLWLADWQINFYKTTAGKSPSSSLEGQFCVCAWEREVSWVNCVSCPLSVKKTAKQRDYSLFLTWCLSYFILMNSRGLFLELPPIYTTCKNTSFIDQTPLLISCRESHL